MKAVILSSGGLDSTTCLGLAVDKYSSTNVITVSIFYGQRHERELQSARAVAEHYDVKHFEFNAAALFQPSDSAMLKHSTQALEHSTYAQQLAAHNKVSTYVPFRNGLMLSMAAAFADGFYDGDELVELYLGVHADDSAGRAYPDCGTDFIDAINRAIEIGTYERVKVIAPFVSLNKSQVVELGLKLNVPYRLTWSCYDDGDTPCGKCATCLDRAAAFAANNVVDPALII
ncbi:MAG: 7-cyano-7-deazaguanine synthase QueC [Selenomonadaceae bacterium]|nr:7-cyano-7-deazaguanine synthase QueC [Selenomonadaceae bacterium]